MELRHLRLIRTVHETGSLSASASRLFLSQSALSHQLKEIENEFRTEVFTRVNKKMVLTPAGERLLITADRIMNELDRNEADLKKLISGENAELRISTHCYTFYHWLAKVLRAYSRDFNGVDVNIITEATYDTVNWLEAGKLDLTIINFDPCSSNLNLYKLFDDELCVVLGAAHPLSGRKMIEPEELIDYTFFTYLTPQYKNITYKEVFESRGLEPAETKRIQITEAILELLKVTDGFTVLSKWAIKPYISRDLRVIKLSRKKICRRWYAATLKYEKTPPYILGFIKALKENYRI
jgi:LysR family transcriptional regulator for metE and metH